MKQLVSLSFKYFRRQRMRTLLTFLCILLSVFVFNLVAGSAGVFRGVMLREEIERSGAWEVRADSLLDACSKNGCGDLSKPMQRIAGHVAVDRWFASQNAYISIRRAEESDAPGYVYLEVTFPDGVSVPCSHLSFSGAAGDMTLQSRSGFVSPTAIVDTVPGAVILPESYREKGWQVGDAFPVTVVPATGTLPDDNPQIQALLKERGIDPAEVKDRRLFTDDPDPVSDGAEKPSVFSASRFSVLAGAVGTEHVQFSDVRRGTPCTEQLTVGGFSPTADVQLSGSFRVSMYTELETVTALAERNAQFCEENEIIIEPHSAQDMVFTVTDRVPFDSAVEAIYSDLGLPENDRDYWLHRNENLCYNLPLLSLEFRGADAIATWLTDFETRLPVLITLTVIAFVLWMLMRAVIDNAFEISVQERKSQFAVLRIMGASRTQVAALVCLEALYYCLGAIPLGMLLAHLLTKQTASRLLQVGIGMPYHASPALLAVFTLLAVSGVFFSAYSSSLWAARAYAPLEAAARTDIRSGKKQNLFTKDLFGGDPEARYLRKMQKMQARGEQKLKAPKKPKLRRSAFSFLRNYTARNIRRSRRGFLISVITMTIGVALFSFGSVILLFWNGTVQTKLEKLQAADFAIMPYTFSFEAAQESERRFADHPLFSAYRHTAHLNLRCDTGSEETMASFREAGAERFADYYAQYQRTSHLPCELIFRSEYEAQLADVMQMDYDTWCKSREAVLLYCAASPEQPVLQRFEKPAELLTDRARVLPVLGMLELTREIKDAVLQMQSPYMLLYPAQTADRIGDFSAGNWQRIELTVADPDQYSAAKDAVAAFVADIGVGCDVTDSFFEGTGLRRYFRALLLIGAIALAAVWLTGILTMVNTVNTSVLNRTGELMMLRTVGMTKRGIRAAVLMESVTFCAAATVIGSIIGLSAAMKFLEVVQYGLDVQLPSVGYLLGALGMVLAVNLLIASVSALPGLRALNQHMEEGARLQ